MASRWSNIAIVCFWLTAMGWLVDQKILPSWFVGDPPTYRTILENAGPAPVGWIVSLNGRPFGWAISQTCPNELGGHVLRSRVLLTRLPLVSLAPGWMSSVLKLFERSASDLRLDVDANSSLGVDPLGRPVDFQSVAELGRAGSAPQLAAGAVRISMRGVVEGSQLKLSLRAGDSVSNLTTYLPSDALLGDALGPQGRLPSLRIGQAWSESIYSPFKQQIEVLQAAVERRETIRWNGEHWSTLEVVLRNDPGSGLSNGQNVRARSWVTADGMVLKQELLLGTSRIVFERVAGAPLTAPALDEQLVPWWPTNVPARKAVVPQHTSELGQP